MKIINWIRKNPLCAVSLFLLAFIPLYPKVPLVDIQNTWVYVRGEDFVVVLVFLIWILMLFFKKVSLKTPLTLPIILFWIMGGISTLHGVLLIFPTLSDVFSNIAFLSFLRRIEYLSLFFIAYTSIKDKKLIPYVVITLVSVLLLIVGYGFGQKFYKFPAFLTMNEEFAKGTPIQLSQLSRIPSTFAGHYDLAAYLVLVLPLIISMVFGFKNRFIKIFLLLTAFLGFILLFMTVSRVSFLVLMFSLILLLLFQKKRWAFVSIVSLFILTLAIVSFSPKLLQRFGSTITEIDVLVDAQTGTAISQVKEVPKAYFENKIVITDSFSNKDPRQASGSAVLPYISIPSFAALAIEPNKSTGEDLPQGTGYINLPLSPVTKKISQYFYERRNPHNSAESAEVRVVHGEFLIKRALAYDLSFTTRFQGEWPKTLLAFRRNVFLGSGYASVSLAVDNDYLRILGETGLFGFISFISIFIIAGIYIKKVLPDVDSPIVKSFVYGFLAGSFGLALNGVLIDVFEASKIAFTYWLLMGITLGTLHMYKKKEIDFYKEFKKAVISPFAIIMYLLVFIVALFFSVYDYYFVGDDFTWFRWVSECYNGLVKSSQCSPFAKTIFGYFTQANGFFYRPGTKIYFYFMYSAFWLNQTVYHIVSIFLHFCAAALVFLIAKKIMKDYFLAVVCAFLFVILSGYSETIFWISATGFLFNGVFSLLGLLLFIYWKEKQSRIYLILSVLSVVCSLLFHELGVIVPFLIILYDIVYGEKFVPSRSRFKKYYLAYLIPLIPYFMLRFIAQSHWSGGDYNYNLLKVPYNFVGNTISYFFLALFGPASLPISTALRNFSKVHIIIAGIALLGVLYVLGIFYRKVVRNMVIEERNIVIFGFLFAVIALLPFLGLGNVTSRYSYLASVGFVILLSLGFKKLYLYLLSNGREIAIAIMIVIALVFTSLHLFQLQKISSDWQHAGEKSKTFLISLDEAYVDYWGTEPMKFYFVNVPIRHGDAWVFPVGLSDAAWFVFRNDRIVVYKMSSVIEAFNAVTAGSRNERVFEFQDDGSVVERKKMQNTPRVSEKK